MILSALLDLGYLVVSGMELSVEQVAELRELAKSLDAPAGLATRARIVLWLGEGRRRKDISELLGELHDEGSWCVSAPGDLHELQTLGPTAADQRGRQLPGGQGNVRHRYGRRRQGLATP